MNDKKTNNQTDHDRTNNRANGSLTDTGESEQLISDLGDRIQEIAGDDGERRADDQFHGDAEPPAAGAPKKQGSRPTLTRPPDLKPRDENLVDERFSPEDSETAEQTTPYQGETDTMPFSEGDKVRGWNTGVGDQQTNPRESD